VTSEIFLSHSSRDRTFANRLAKALGRRGYKVFYSRKSILGAQQWHDEIGLALARCNWFLIVLSPSAVRSEWVKRELVYALQARRYRKRIAPLLLKSCNVDRLSWTLSGFQYVDFRKSFNEGLSMLLSAWNQPDGFVVYGSRPRRKS
jgi:hypothetical protein